MIRLIQIALLLAIIIPFGWAVKWGVMSLPEYWRDMGFAALVGFFLCWLLWQWDNRIKERQSRGEFSRWD